MNEDVKVNEDKEVKTDEYRSKGWSEEECFMTASFSLQCILGSILMR